METGATHAANELGNSVLSEADAIRFAQLGDSGAFEYLYRLHSRRVYALCLRMTGSPVEAQDFTQDAFLQVFRKIQSFRGESSFSTWLHRLTVNVVLMRFRKRRCAEVSLDDPAPADEQAGAPLEVSVPDLRVRGTMDRLLIQRALDRLPEGYKLMFVLHDIQGYGHDEIAQILGCSVGNSKSQLHKARMRMRELLTKRIRRGRRKRAASAAPLPRTESTYSLASLLG